MGGIFKASCIHVNRTTACLIIKKSFHSLLKLCGKDIFAFSVWSKLDLKLKAVLNDLLGVINIKKSSVVTADMALLSSQASFIV